MNRHLGGYYFPLIKWKVVYVLNYPTLQRSCQLSSMIPLILFHLQGYLAVRINFTFLAPLQCIRWWSLAQFKYLLHNFPIFDTYLPSMQVNKLSNMSSSHRVRGERIRLDTILDGKFKPNAFNVTWFRGMKDNKHSANMGFSQI